MSRTRGGIIVDKVHTQLECLKYVGGNQNGSLSTGEGIDVSILLLPDLLLDFHEYRVRRNLPGKLCVVGGRAARIACALLHLQDENDATYRAHLLTRTGNLGRLLVENEFTNPLSNRAARHVDLDLVFTRFGEPRCAIVEVPNAPLFESRPAEAEQELMVDQIRLPQTRRVLRRVKTICITSITVPQFPQLLEEILGTVDGARQVLFIDTTRPHEQTTIDSVLEQLKVRKALSVDQGPSPLFLFLPTDTQRLARVTSIEEFCAEYRVNVIAYQEDKALVYLLGADRPNAVVEATVPFEHEGIPERFKAGVLLAHTLFRSLSDVRDKDLYSLLRAQWPANEWEQVLDYGVALACASRDRPGACTLRELLDDEGRGVTPHLPDPGSFSPLINVTTRFPGENYGRLKVGPCMEDFARLAGYRRQKTSSGGAPGSTVGRDLCPDLAVCSTPRCAEGCPRRASGRPASPTAAILIDLDGTLIDSTEQRSLALIPALQTLLEVASGLAPPLEDPAAFFAAHVYNPWPVYRYLLKLGDFRQTWNHPGWYASFLALANNEELADQLRRGWLECKEPVERPRQQAEWIARQTWWKDWSERFLNAYERAIREQAEAIRAAQTAFETVKLAPLKEARDLLSSLSLTGAFWLYVVSEGEPETQWLKLKSTGLDAFVKRSCLLTTGEAAEPVRERAQLMEEQSRLEREYAELDREYKMLDAQLGLLGSIRARIKRGPEPDLVQRVFDEQMDQEIPKKLDALQAKRERIGAQLDAVRFVDLVLTVMAQKGGLSFHAAVIRAILRNPESPRDELRSFGHLIDGSVRRSEFKFAVIGDRQTNDIDPPTRLLDPEHVVTVRLLSGKYAESEPPDARYAFPPTFVAETLAQAKAILLCKSTWDAIHCKGDPPVFKWKVDFADPDHHPNRTGETEMVAEVDWRIGVHHVLYGIAFSPNPQSITSRVCAGVLAEHLTRSDADFGRVLMGCEQLPVDGGLASPPVVRRVRVLCALVDAGFQPSWRIAGRFRQQLEEDRRELNSRTPRPEDLLSMIDRALERLSRDEDQPHHS